MYYMIFQLKIYNNQIFQVDDMTKDLITCPIENTLKLLNRKWTIVLIRDMFQKKKYFREFSQIEGLSNTVLADTLKEMESNGLVTKNDSEYHLTDKVLRLNRVLYEMAAKKNQKYYFLFVESNGRQLKEVSRIFAEKNIKPSVDEIFSLNDVNRAMKKVDQGGSKGKTLIKIE